MSLYFTLTDKKMQLHSAQSSFGGEADLSFCFSAVLFAVHGILFTGEQAL